MGMRPQYVTLADASVDPVEAIIPLNWRATPFNITLRAIVTGTDDYSVEYTSDDIRAEGWNPATANWSGIQDMVNAVATAEATLISPVRALRFTLNSGDGSVQLQVISAGK
jgi:hypothetical protein